MAGSSVLDMTAIAERPAWAMSGAELLHELDTVNATLSHLQTRRLHLIARLDQTGHARDLGARDTVELLALRHRLDPTHVRRDLRLAVALPSHPAVTAALSQHADTSEGTATDTPQAQPNTDQLDGDVNGAAQSGAVAPFHPAQAQAIVEALERLPRTIPATHLAVAETEMVTAARTLNPRDLRRLGRAITDRLDTDGPAPDEDAALTRQEFWLTPTTLGAASAVRFGGLLANENAELLHTLVDAAAKPRSTPTGEPDPRTLAQRRADALTIVLRAAAASGGEIPTHGGIKPHLTVTVPLAALTSAGPNHPAAAADHTQTQADEQAPLLGDLCFGHGLSPGAARRLACDAGIIPIVLGTHSEPLDVGREHRLVTPAIRRALITRDRGCIIPGCGAPPGHCDAHHIIHWADGGETTILNLVLVCPAHHRAIHRGTWTITVTNGQPHATRPDWTEPGLSPLPRTSKVPGPGRLPTSPIASVSRGPAIAPDTAARPTTTSSTWTIAASPDQSTVRSRATIASAESATPPHQDGKEAPDPRPPPTAS